MIQIHPMFDLVYFRLVIDLLDHDQDIGVRIGVRTIITISMITVIAHITATVVI